MLCYLQSSAKLVYPYSKQSSWFLFSNLSRLHYSFVGVAVFILKAKSWQPLGQSWLIALGTWRHAACVEVIFSEKEKKKKIQKNGQHAIMRNFLERETKWRAITITILDTIRDMSSSWDRDTARYKIHTYVDRYQISRKTVEHKNSIVHISRHSG